MSKLSTFFYSFKKSISSLNYYRDVVRVPFMFSFKYFWVFSLIIGFVITLSLSLVITKPLQTFINRLQNRSLTIFPEDLIITIKDGQVSTNVTEPLHFPIPYELLFDVPPAVSDQKQLYLLTIDTKANADDFDQSQSLVLVTKNKIYLKDDNGGMRIYPIESEADATINKSIVNDAVQKIFPLLKYIIPFVLIVIFISLGIILPLVRLASLVFLTLILLVSAKMMHLPLGYLKLYQIGLHALTLPTLIQIGMIVLNIQVPLPFFNSIVFLLYSLVILATLRETKLPASK